MIVRERGVFGCELTNMPVTASSEAAKLLKATIMASLCRLRLQRSCKYGLGLVST
jgi:hypothetical protein